MLSSMAIPPSLRASSHWRETKSKFEYSPGEYINPDYQPTPFSHQSTPFSHPSCHTEEMSSNKDSPTPDDDLFSTHASSFSEAGSSHTHL